MHPHDPHVFLILLGGLGWLFGVAILFAGLWFVVKTAVLSALRRHQRDLDERPAPVITKK